MEISSLEDLLRQRLTPVEPRAEFVTKLGRQLRRMPPGPPSGRQSMGWWWILAGLGGASLIFLGIRLLTALARRAPGFVPPQPAHSRT